MAFEHKKEPIAAVQFHPESIMTLGHNAGMRMIENVVAHMPRKARTRRREGICSPTFPLVGRAGW